MKRAFTIVLMILALDAAAFGAREDTSASATKALAALEELHSFLSPNKNTYLLGEPAHLKLILANWSDKIEFDVKGDLNPANDVVIEVTRANELPTRYLGTFRREGMVPGTALGIRPRQIAALRWTMCWEPDHASGYLFEQPGHYTVTCRARMTINGNPRDLGFKPAEIEILAPTTAEQKGALALIQSAEYAEQLQKIQATQEGVKTWQELAERFPKSVWAPYAKLLVARFTLDNSSRDFDPVARQLEAIIADYPDFALRDDACYLMATCQDRMGRPIEALRWLYRIQREYPSSPYITQGIRLFRKYLYPEGWEDRYGPWFLRE